MLLLSVSRNFRGVYPAVSGSTISPSLTCDMLGRAKRRTDLVELVALTRASVRRSFRFAELTLSNSSRFPLRGTRRSFRCSSAPRLLGSPGCSNRELFSVNLQVVFSVQPETIIYIPGMDYSLFPIGGPGNDPENSRSSDHHSTVVQANMQPDLPVAELF